MVDLLSRDDYYALAGQIDFPRTAFIDGRFQAGHGNEFETLNPATGQQLTTIAGCDAGDVDLAVARAREAHDAGRWSKIDPSERKDTLIRLCKLMTRNRRELAVLESLESGKPIRDCELVDVPEAIQAVKWHAEATDKLYDQMAPTGDHAIAMIVREPLGVVGLVLPWNFPLLMLAWKIGPALSAGNAVIVKPAEQTSMTALRVAELAHEAGVPRGIFQVLPGDGPSVGEPLGRHHDVDMVSFTGSTETGRRFLHYAADSNLKKTVLECGGKNPAVVLSDAEHLDYVAEQITNAAFWNMGENCSANSRLVVHKSVHDALMERIYARLRNWRIGDPLDPANSLGALVDTEHTTKVTEAIRGAKNPPRVGGTSDGNFVPPTIFDDVPASDALAREEIFGPVLAVVPVFSDDEAIAVANDTNYGLTASVFSAHTRKVLRAARELKAGTVTVNCFGEGSIATPFGGYKESGFGGRDNSHLAHDQFTETKTIWVDLSDPADGDLIQ